MSLRGCFGCLKFLVFVVNFLFWLFGLGVMAVSLWLLFDQQLYLQSIGAHQTDYYIGTYIILGIGGIMTLVGFLGCCGAWKESTWMLGTFFILLIFIFIGEIAVGALIYLQEAPYKDVISRSVEATVKRKYHSNSTATTQTFDLIQEGLRCCGHNEPLDWARSVYNGHSQDQLREIGIPHNSKTPTNNGITIFNIPESCCKLPSTADCFAAVTKVEPGRIPSDKIYTKGCSEALIDFVDLHFIYLIAVGGGVVVLQLIGMVFSLCLCCALRRIEDFKA
ncbi:hypothetical protein TCAL_03336 [Tigriopus californicus]|uniref:Tetraspanin n=1 Tax=Tigriopus californicus TaxID=6832 RepID=A0A553P5T6_TIGCA|nr:CD9 antigen-like [Tigriopus californicus]TRY73046.1 hypothetical protein TCAL_03336 [Tigriopus californicus]